MLKLSWLTLSHQVNFVSVLAPVSLPSRCRKLTNLLSSTVYRSGLVYLFKLHKHIQQQTQTSTYRQYIC